MTAVSLHKQPDAQLKAYRTIIRQSDMVLAVYDPASARGDDTDKAISYARELRRPMLMIHPDTLKTICSLRGSLMCQRTVLCYNEHRKTS